MMGERELIPLSEAVKSKVDVATAGGSLLGYFKAIPWPELAAFLACVYTALRIIEVAGKWWRRRK
jgi:hypothetical protein